jgi:hypothetical protein
MTENPRVVRGFIDIYGDWIERYASMVSASTPRGT